MGKSSDVFCLEYFELRHGELYYEDKSMSLTIRRGKLRLVCFIVEILDIEGLRNLGFDIPRGKITVRQAVMLNRVAEELPSITDVAKADDIELQEIMENVARSTGNLIEQLEGEFSDDLLMRELLGLDKQLGSITGVQSKWRWQKRFS